MLEFLSTPSLSLNLPSTSQIPPRRLSTAFDEFAQLFLEGLTPYGSYFDHVAAFWSLRHEDNILLLTYEELKRDLRAAARKVALFLEKDVPEEKMDSLMEHLSFRKMKENPACNLEVVVKMAGAKENTFIRKGESGGWKEYFGEEMARKFDEEFRRRVPGVSFD